MFNKLKRNSKLGLLFLLILSLITYSFIVVSSNQISPSEERNYLNYTTSDPLFIDNDSDLIGNSTSGSGIPGDPYVIEDLSIVTTDTYGIYIADTTVNFIIKDCYIEAGSYGIYIYDPVAGTAEIDNNIIKNCAAGILIDGADYANVTNNHIEDNSVNGLKVDMAWYTLVKNNTCINSGIGILGSDAHFGNFIDNKPSQNDQYGIRVVNSDYCNLTENICNNNNYAGIYLGNSNASALWDNECYDNSYHGIATYMDILANVSLNTLYDNSFHGLFTQFSIDNIIAENTVYSNDGIGIFVQLSTGTLIEDNILTNDGFHFDLGGSADYGGLTVNTNLVNGKPLGYFYDVDDTVISTNIYGQVYLASCDNTIVKDLRIDNTDIAATLRDCDSSVIDNCDFGNNLGGSVKLDGTLNCTVSSTICTHNPTKPGIVVGGGIDSVLINCTSNNNFYGLQTYSSTNITVLNSIFNLNTIINAFFAEGGLANIKYNGFTNAGSDGVKFQNFDYANVSHNHFENNIGYGMYVDSLSTGSWIHHNAFIGNNLGGVQAFDDTNSFNLWDDPWNLEGNYWDDHVSGNYTLDGTFKVNDTYPLGSIPPGVFEYKQLTYIIILVPVVFVSSLIIRRRKK
jgi:parallel beta-helix repeat protein